MYVSVCHFVCSVHKASVLIIGVVSPSFTKLMMHEHRWANITTKHGESTAHIHHPSNSPPPHVGYL